MQRIHACPQMAIEASTHTKSVASVVLEVSNCLTLTAKLTLTLTAKLTFLSQGDAEDLPLPGMSQLAALSTGQILSGVSEKHTESSKAVVWLA